MAEAYRPINCEVHDELELFCLRRARKRIQYRDGGRHCTIEAQCQTITVRSSEEFLEVTTATGPLSIRLDNLLQIDPV